MEGVLDIEREQDIERLRQVALLQKRQLERAVDLLARKCEELEKLQGSSGELQLALKLLAETEKEIAAIEEAERRIARGSASGLDEEPTSDDQGEPQPGHGPTEQLELERVALRCDLDEPIARAPRVAAA